MPQYGRPHSDIITGTWTSTPLYQKIDETTKNTGDYIQARPSTGSITCEVGLSAVTDPQTSTNHILRYTYRKNNTTAPNLNITIALKEGSSTIATWTHNDIGNSWTDAVQTLSAAEANSITDYTNLSVEITAQTTVFNWFTDVQVAWVEFEAPDAGSPTGPAGSKTRHTRLASKVGGALTS